MNQSPVFFPLWSGRGWKAQDLSGPFSLLQGQDRLGRGKVKAETDVFGGGGASWCPEAIQMNCFPFSGLPVLRAQSAGDERHGLAGKNAGTP